MMTPSNHPTSNKYYLRKEKPQRLTLSTFPFSARFSESPDQFYLGIVAKYGSSFGGDFTVGKTANGDEH